MLISTMTPTSGRLRLEKSVFFSSVALVGTVLAMVRSGLGFAFMPEYAVNDPGVVARPLVEPEFFRQVNLVTVRGRPYSPAVGALVREAMRTKWHGEQAIAVKNAAA